MGMGFQKGGLVFRIATPALPLPSRCPALAPQIRDELSATASSSPHERSDMREWTQNPGCRSAPSGLL